ncbi:segregation and condensation protein B [Sulfolobus sp. A20-N-F6]|nr:segregation and condensation protein B [Sulfolobus sp. A20-N-F8]TRM83842.1 segregation and condensation protein B [Sulfolobus sp. A20-N-F6]
MKYRVIEALLYVQSEQGLTSEQLQQSLKLEKINEARKLLKDYMIKFNRENRGITIVEFNDVFKFVTAKDVKPFLIDFVSNERKYKLTNSAIEVAAIIAYKQPVTRSMINQIRGGKISDSIVGSLLAKGIVEELGNAPTVGNPILYGVTNKFFDYFKLRSLKDLPKFKEFDYYVADNNTDEVIQKEAEAFDLYSSQRELDSFDE